MAHRVLLLLLLAMAADGQPVAPPSAASAPTAPARKADEPRFSFSILPKSLQKNPELEITMMGEVTAEGKKLPPVSPERPAYFALFSAGYHPMGDSYGDKTLLPDDIERVLTRSLAGNGYLPAKVPVRPSLLVIYVWGSHNRVSDGDDDENTLSRTHAVGGRRCPNRR